MEIIVFRYPELNKYALQNICPYRQRPHLNFFAKESNPRPFDKRNVSENPFRDRLSLWHYELREFELYVPEGRVHVEIGDQYNLYTSKIE